MHTHSYIRLIVAMQPSAIIGEQMTNENIPVLLLFLEVPKSQMTVG